MSIRRINLGVSSTIEQTITTVIGETYVIVADIDSFALAPTIVLDDVDVKTIIDIGITSVSFVATATTHRYGINTDTDDITFGAFGCFWIEKGLVYTNFTAEMWTTYYVDTGNPVGETAGDAWSLLGSFPTGVTSTLTEGTNVQGIQFDPTGTKLYQLDYNNDTVYQYTLDPAWDVTTITYASK